MKRVYKLSETDLKKPYRMDWDGDTFFYTVYESETEKEKERARLEKIEKEYKRAKEKLKESNLY